jgi:hypothetical protein
MAKSLTASDASGDNKILLATVGVDTSLSVKPVILPYFSKQPSISAVSIQADGIIADNIDALAITSKHTITGATIQTAASGERSIMNSTGIQILHSPGSATTGTFKFTDTSGNFYGMLKGQTYTYTGSSTQNTLALYGPGAGSHSAYQLANFGYEIGTTQDAEMVLQGSLEIKDTGEADSSDPSEIYWVNSSKAIQGSIHVAGSKLIVKDAALAVNQRVLLMDTDHALTDYWVFNVKQDSGGTYRKFMYPSNAIAGGTADGTVNESFSYIGSYDNSGTWTYAPISSIGSYYYYAGDGTLAGPSQSFMSDSNTGFYRISSGNIGVSGDATQRAQFGFHSQTIAPSSGSTTAYVSFSVLGNYGLWGASGPSYFNHIRPAIDDFYDVGSSTLRFDDVYATSGTVNISDARAKEKISPSTLGLSFINDLNPVSYKWKKKKENKLDQTHYGIVAQEVMETLKKYGVDSVEDFGGITHDGGEEDYYGARYGEFVPILIKAVQELSAEIKELKEKT